MLRGLATYLVESLPFQSDGSPIRAIYAIRNRVTGNFYIGSSDHIHRRFRHHVSQLRRGIHHSVRLQYAWKNRGEGAFEFLVLEVHGAGEDLIAREAAMVAAHSPAYNFNLEFADNPMKGRRHSAASIEKMKMNRRGKGLGPRKFSDAHRAALSLAFKGKPRIARRGKNIPLDARRKMAASAKRKFASGFVNGRTRAIVFDGIQYPSGKDAASALRKSHSWIVAKIQKGRGSYLS